MKQAVLLGMPNCGKSSLYHLLTGKRVPTGNRAGVTVEASSAPLSGSDGRILLTDLPGIRSAQPASEDEEVTFRYLSDHSPDLLIVVFDSTDFKRQMQPLSALAERSGAREFLAVFNFCDELERFPDAGELSKAMGISSIAVSARTGRGIPELLAGIRRLISEPGSEKSRESGFGICRDCNNCEHTATCVSAVLGDVSGAYQTVSTRLDRIFLRPVLGFPIFFAVMAGILWLTFGTPGEALTAGFCNWVLLPLTGVAERVCQSAPIWLHSLVVDGILGGVGAVLSFLPRLMMLFLFQSFLEQSGFLARASRLFDAWFRPLGLRGDAVTPLLLGFGCSVPAILCTRAMKDCKARERCASFLPSVACSARMPLCLMLADCWFPGSGWAVCALIWLFTGVCFLLFCALTAKWEGQRALPDRHDDPLPRWRFPDGRELLSAVWGQAVHFVSRAGGLIFLCAVLVWLLSNFRLGTPGLVEPEESMLAEFGKLLAPVFAPAGFGDWRLVAALLAGIGAKEAALSTLGVLFGGGQGLAAAMGNAGLLSPASALSFLIFYALYFPCTATLSAMRRKERRLLWLPLVFAYLLAVLVYQTARWL